MDYPNEIKYVYEYIHLQNSSIVQREKGRGGVTTYIKAYLEFKQIDSNAAKNQSKKLSVRINNIPTVKYNNHCYIQTTNRKHKYVPYAIRTNFSVKKRHSHYYWRCKS